MQALLNRACILVHSVCEAEQASVDLLKQWQGLQLRTVKATAAQSDRTHGSELVPSSVDAKTSPQSKPLRTPDPKLYADLTRSHTCPRNRKPQTLGSKLPKT